MNSLSLLLVACAGFGGAVLSNAVSGCSFQERSVIVGNMNACGLVGFLASKMLAVACFAYSVLFYLFLADPENLPFLGVQWNRGGQIFACVVYGVTLLFSAMWLPLARRSEKKAGGVKLVILAAAGEGVGAVVLMIAAYMLPLGAGRSGWAVLRVHQLAAGIFALLCIVTDVIIWPIVFRAALRKRRERDSLLGGRERRQSINAQDEGGDECCTPAWCSAHKRVKDLYANTDWNSVWIGFFCLFVLIIAATWGAKQDDIPLPRAWRNNPLDSISGATPWLGRGFGDFPGAGLISGIISLLCVMLSLMVPLGFSSAACADGPAKVLPPFVFLFFLAVISIILGRQETLGGLGLTATLWALLIGMLITNASAGRLPRFRDWVRPASKLGEFYIKVGLVLLCVELKTLGLYGWPAFLVAWGVTPIVLIFTWLLGTSGWLDCCGKMEPTLVMLLACGLSVCGTSAIAATRGAIAAPNEEAVLAISLVSVSTLVFMLGLPYLSQLTGLVDYGKNEIGKLIAGAWIGGSVNNTGNVVAAAALLCGPDEARCDAEEVAAIVKMIQNAMIGFITVGITLYWLMVIEPR